MRISKNKKKTLDLILCSLFAALICVATLILKVPSPLGGYLHLGDALVLLSGFLLGPLYGTAAAAIGSMLADLFAGYALYVPATLLIKGVCALIACVCFALFSRLFAKHKYIACILSGSLAELWMALGYYLYEATVCGYGFIPALIGIWGNLMQGLSGIVLGTALLLILQKTKIISRFFHTNTFIGKE